jgi:hypothetical protein
MLPLTQAQLKYKTTNTVASGQAEESNQIHYLTDTPKDPDSFRVQTCMNLYHSQDVKTAGFVKMLQRRAVHLTLFDCSVHVQLSARKMDLHVLSKATFFLQR